MYKYLLLKPDCRKIGPDEKQFVRKAGSCLYLFLFGLTMKTDRRNGPEKAERKTHENHCSDGRYLWESSVRV